MGRLSKFLFFIVLVLGIIYRLNLFPVVGRDSHTYKRAVIELLNNENPYDYTIHTYTKEKQDWDHGFSYFPAMLYILAPFYFIGELTKTDSAILWKIPILFADIGIALLIFYQISKKNNFLALLATSIWLFNPYIVLKTSYTYLDPLPILFMLLALVYSEKDDVLSGTFIALSILLKTFPVILLPILFFRSKNKTNFVLSGFLTALLVFLPFMNSFERFRTMILGSFFVHGDRVVQGRPFLYFISFLTSIELIRIIPTKFYSVLSLISAFLISIFGGLVSKYDKFVISTISFIAFYLITPVLNRTYLLWFMPVLLIALSTKLKPKYSILISLAFFVFYSWYLHIWIDGFHITARL